MYRYLNGEVQDREQRIQSIDRVRRKWSRNRSKGLRGNREKKAAWLLDLPRQKGVSASRRTSMIHVMHSNVFGFGDYLMYDLMLDSMGYGGFLPFDVFGRCGDERMPYDGFVGEVLPDVSEWRDEYGPASYAEIDAALNEAHADEFAAEADGVEAAALGAVAMDALNDADVYDDGDVSEADGADTTDDSIADES
jgi:hypothetical protein